MSETPHQVAEKVVLERRRLSKTFYVSHMMRAEPYLLYDDLAAEMIRVESEVLAERVVSDTQTVAGTVEFPESPWQFFKARHADSWWLRWLVRRRPVRYAKHLHEATVYLTRYATYPSATLLPQDTFGEPVLWDNVETDWRDRGRL